MPPATSPARKPRRARRSPAGLTLPGLELPDKSTSGIVCRQYGLNHSYRVDGVKWPGVTTISGLLKGPGLMDYTGRIVAQYAVDQWDELEKLAPVARYNALYNARWSDRDYAAQRGTQVHKIGARLAHGEEVEYPEELAAHVENYRDWLDKVNPAMLWSEVVVCNRAVRYCGRLDGIADFPPMIDGQGQELPAARTLFDVKTSRSGVWPETALQCAGYRYAEVFVDPASGEERPMDWLGIQQCGVVWVTSDSCQFIPVYTGPEVWHYFQALAWIYWRDEMKKEWVGAAAEPTGNAAPIP